MVTHKILFGRCRGMGPTHDCLCRQWMIHECLCGIRSMRQDERVVPELLSCTHGRGRYHHHAVRPSLTMGSVGAACVHRRCVFEAMSSCYCSFTELRAELCCISKFRPLHTHTHREHAWKFWCIYTIQLPITLLRKADRAFDQAHMGLKTANVTGTCDDGGRGCMW